jgi:cupin 2 domain-containing protein
MRPTANLFDTTTAQPGAERFETLLETGALRLEHIVSHGQASPPGHWYDQPDPEWVLLAQGTATLVFDDDNRLSLAAGDHLLIPARTRHRVEACSEDAIWLALHFREA